MVRVYLFIILYFVLFAANAQLIHVIDMDNSYIPTSTIDEVNIINENLDVSDIPKIATLKCTCNNTANETIVHLFKSLIDKASELGANSFKINDFTHRSKGFISMNISLYYLTEDELAINKGLFPQNLVYVFGEIENNKEIRKIIKFNKEKIELKPLEYICYQNTMGQDATVSIGGITGDKVWIRGQAGRLPKHLSVTGFKFNPYITDNKIGISLSTGKIYPLDFNLGQFMAASLTENKKMNYSAASNCSIRTAKLEKRGYLTETNFQYGKLIIFRKGKRELDTPIEFSINDSLINAFIPNSFLETKPIISGKPVVIKYNKNLKDSLEVKLNLNNRTLFVECSLTKGENKISMKIVNNKTGEFYSEQAKHFQSKRKKMERR